MKNFTLITVCLLSFMLRANAQSNCIFFAEQGEKFWLVINGVKQNTDPQTNVKVTGLVAPNYKSKIIFENNNFPDIDKMIYFNSPGEYTYNVTKNNKGEYVLRYLSMVPIVPNPPVVPNQYVVIYGSPAPTTTTVVTTPTGTVQQTTTTTTTTGNPNDNVNMNVGMNLGGVGIGMNVNVNDGTTGTTQSTTTYSQTTTTTSTGGVVVVDPMATQTTTTTVYVPGYAGPVGCPMPMMPGDFASAKSSISSKDFESTKLEIAKQIVGSNCLTADQVKEVMQLFDFESSKLDFAKFAYGHTYDKGNYFKVNDAFEFESSVSDLNSYIGH